MPLRKRQEIQEMLRVRLGKAALRHVLAGGILVFWLIMMALLVRRELLVPRLTGARRSPSVPTDSWMAIYLPGKVPAGFVNVKTIPESYLQHPEDGGEAEAEDGVRIHLSLQLGLMLFGKPVQVTVLGTGWVSDERGLTECSLRVRSGDILTRIEAHRAPAGVGGEVLDVRVHTAGEVLPFQLPVTRELALWGGGGLSSFELPALEVGEEYTVDTFDPMTLSLGEARLKCVSEESLTIAGRSVETSVVLVTLNAMTTKAWVTREGEVVRMETPIGLTLEKTTPHEALAFAQGEPGSTLLEMAAVRPGGKRPRRDAGRMVVRISGLETGLELPTDDRQVHEGQGVYTILASSKVSTNQEGIGEHLAEFLEGDPFIQADHPVIQARAAAIVGQEREPWSRAQRVYDWVHENIEKVSVVSLPSALEVLRTQKGDCNEHTVVFAALARAARVPTRVALGVVWSEEYEGFYYHAWPEVYAGRWIAMDPTLGQPVADATHVKLLTGSIERWPELIHFLGRLRIEVIEIE